MKINTILVYIKAFIILSENPIKNIDMIPAFFHHERHTL